MQVRDGRTLREDTTAIEAEATVLVRPAAEDKNVGVGISQVHVARTPGACNVDWSRSEIEQDLEPCAQLVKRHLCLKVTRIKAFHVVLDDASESVTLGLCVTPCKRWWCARWHWWRTHLTRPALAFRAVRFEHAVAVHTCGTAS